MFLEIVGSSPDGAEPQFIFIFWGLTCRIITLTHGLLRLKYYRRYIVFST